MEFEDPQFLLILATSITVIAGSAAAGGWIAMEKRRSPLQGVLLGLFLGPIGVLVAWRCSFVQRPEVDKKALNSLQSMLVFQEAGRETDRRSKRRAENRMA